MTDTATAQQDERVPGGARVDRRAAPPGAPLVPVQARSSGRRLPQPDEAPAGYRAKIFWERRQVKMLLAFDFVSIAVAVAIAYLVRFGDEPTLPYVAMSVLLPVLWVLSMSFGRSYEPRFLGAGHEEFRRVLDSAVRVTALLALVSYATKAEIARTYVLIALPVATALALGGRFAGRMVLLRLRAQGRCQYRVLVVGNGESAAELVRAAARHPLSGWNVVGVCLNRTFGRRHYDLQEGLADIAGVPIVGTFENVIDAIRRVGASTVAVAECPELEGDTLRRVMWELEGTDVDVLVGSALTDVTGPRISIRPVAGLPLLHVEEPELTGARRLLKGGVDRLVALVLVLLTLPLLLALAVAVRLTSRGPAIFRQTRVGRAGKLFTMYKFRSMYVDAEARLADLETLNERAEGLLFKMRNDPRVTPVGRFLRKWSLDELPQLFNVLNGTMSLVGPRPPLEREVAKYADDVRRRLLVKPGLTGLWQVSGRSDLAWDESVRLDLGYVENWSLAMDFVILARTVMVVLRRSGAY